MFPVRKNRNTEYRRSRSRQRVKRTVQDKKVFIRGGRVQTCPVGVRAASLWGGRPGGGRGNGQIVFTLANSFSGGGNRVRREKRGVKREISLSEGTQCAA